MSKRAYIAIDLKSFYASVECMEQGLDPLTTNLVVADVSRTEKTICLAVSPSLKQLGIPGRPRLFEVVQKVKKANQNRQRKAPHHTFAGESSNADVLSHHPELAISYIVARPRMSLYMQRSREIYEIYLRYVAPEDIHVYSIDEVFIDVTGYLRTSGLTPHGFALMLIREVLKETGITATAGIGENLYLAKVAMDIVAKHVDADEDGVRIAELDELSYRKELWNHRPLTDFWRVGRGYARKLEENGMWTMGDIARASLQGPDQRKNEALLYELFGVNAELLIDHAWGWEPCTIADVKAYKPSSNSLGAGQVLTQPYDFEKSRLVVHEMAEQLAMSLLEKHLVSDTFVLTVGYDIENIEHGSYRGETTTDYYGRTMPKHAHGTAHLQAPTSSARTIVHAVLDLFDKVANKELLTRRFNLTAANVVDENSVSEKPGEAEQLTLNMGLSTDNSEQEVDTEQLKLERQRQEAMLKARKRFGKNAVLKGMDLREGATTIDRNSRIGGHLA